MAPNEQADPGWSGLCRAGGVAALLLMAYSLATMVQLVVLGGPPATAAAAWGCESTRTPQNLLRTADAGFQAFKTAVLAPNPKTFAD